jgi:ubiquinone/menaquinone biosynthesis C-methylase UbiE
MPRRMLTREELRRVYDRMGSLLDTQGFYEDRGTEILVAHGAFESAHRVLEFGCGTARFAQQLLSAHLPSDARYRALDLSPTMVALAQKRLAPFGERAEVVLTDGSPPSAERGASRDRFVSNYVLDLLPEDDIAAVIGEAHRILAPGGLLCAASLSGGIGPFSRLLSRTWSRLHALRPTLVGGCRPIDLSAWLPGEQWRMVHHAEIAPFGVPLGVVVAERR